MSTPQPSYSERLTVPLRWWVQTTMLIATFWIALVVAVPEPWAWALTAGMIALMAVCFLAYGSAQVRVADGELSVGKAHIPLSALGAAEALDKEQMRLAAGRDADARAFFVLRPYLKRGVRVQVTDPGDPTPYWLFHVRRPDRVIAALGAPVDR